MNKRLCGLTYLIGVVLAMAHPAWATNYTWIGGDGNWTDSASWNPAGPPPTTSDYAFVSNGATVTVNTLTTANMILLAGTTNSSGTLRLETGGKISYFKVGQIGQGTLNMTDGQIAANSSTSYVGDTATATGVVNQSGGQASGYQFVVGNNGTGTWNVSGSGEMTWQYLDIGSGTGNGTVRQTGGTVKASTVVGSCPLRIGSGGSSGVGLYEVSGGTLNAVGWQSGAIYVGRNGNGTLRIMGGDAVVKTAQYIQNAKGTLDVVLKANGVSTIQCTNTVAGNATASLNGALNITVDGFAPDATTTVTLLTARDGVTGQFTNGTRYTGSWGSCDITYNPTSVVLSNFVIIRPPEPVTVQGTVLLQNYVGDNLTIGARVRFLSRDGHDNITRYVFLNTDGSFTLDNILEGSYDIAVKTANSLETVLDNVTILGNPTVLGEPIVLRSADVNGDDTVSFEDFAALQNNYGERGQATNPLAAAAAAGGCGPLALALLAGLGLSFGVLKPRRA